MEELLKQFEEQLKVIVSDAVHTAMSDYDVATSTEVQDTYNRVDYLKTDFDEFIDKFGRVFRS